MGPYWQEELIEVFLMQGVYLTLLSSLDQASKNFQEVRKSVVFIMKAICGYAC